MSSFRLWRSSKLVSQYFSINESDPGKFIHNFCLFIWQTKHLSNFKASQIDPQKKKKNYLFVVFEKNSKLFGSKSLVFLWKTTDFKIDAIRNQTFVEELSLGKEEFFGAIKSQTLGKESSDTRLTQVTQVVPPKTSHQPQSFQ